MKCFARLPSIGSQSTQRHPWPLCTSVQEYGKYGIRDKSQISREAEQNLKKKVSQIETIIFSSLLTYNVEESDPRLGGGCVDLAHIRALVRVLDVPDLK